VPEWAIDLRCFLSKRVGGNQSGVSGKIDKKYRQEITDRVGFLSSKINVIYRG
jgi:hypothetical protein